MQPKSATPERRYLACEFRVSDSDKPTISGYAAVFNSASEDMGYREYIDPGAFDSVLATNPDVRCLWNHDSSSILGRTKSGTMRLSTDERGLRYECDLPDTQVAHDLAVSMRRGDVTQSSFAFVCGGNDTWEEDDAGNWTRRIHSFTELIDCSPVTYPAYPDTTSGVRSLPDSMPMELRSKLTAPAPTPDHLQLTKLTDDQTRALAARVDVEAAQ